jgi:hypothetical protein
MYHKNTGLGSVQLQRARTGVTTSLCLPCDHEALSLTKRQYMHDDVVNNDKTQAQKVHMPPRDENMLA